MARPSRLRRQVAARRTAHRRRRRRRLPTGEAGTIYFADGPEFSYHNDPKKTAEARNDKGWSTLGDVGYVDKDGYLYLTDRKAFMIISGGVNIYPQEAENVLINHPKVADVAVIGVPNEDFGEEVKAVVQPMNWADAKPSVGGGTHGLLPRAALRRSNARAASISSASCRVIRPASSTSA